MKRKYEVRTVGAAPPASRWVATFKYAEDAQSFADLMDDRAENDRIFAGQMNDTRHEIVIVWDDA